MIKLDRWSKPLIVVILALSTPRYTALPDQLLIRLPRLLLA